MSEDLFPSGPWVGFYNYGPGDRHRMNLHLTFAKGTMRGDGNDDVGRFLIRGGYDAANRECHWTKTYPGSHDVYYRGFREGKGIWGTWEIGLMRHGGFHIWPKGLGEGETESASAEVSLPSEAVDEWREAEVDQKTQFPPLRRLSRSTNGRVASVASEASWSITRPLSDIGENPGKESIEKVVLVQPLNTEFRACMQRLFDAASRAVIKKEAAAVELPFQRPVCRNAKAPKPTNGARFTMPDIAGKPPLPTHPGSVMGSGS